MEKYEEPELEVITFDESDIIIVSDGCTDCKMIGCWDHVCPVH